jgi:dTDP-4-dehydrorhamnose 3,5-epimerase
MIFIETKLKGAYIIELEKLEDERGFFGRSFCAREFEKHGLNPGVVQCNVSYNRKKGTLRGMHLQIGQHAEAKLVRCTMGAIYDVIVDLRPDSTTYKQWIGVELYADGPRLPAPGSRLTADGSLLTAHRSLSPNPCSQLTAHYKMLYIPEGFAHGFITLEDHTEVFYQMSEFFAPDSARGYRWNDPAFNIRWPMEPIVISDRDNQYPDYEVSSKL